MAYDNKKPYNQQQDQAPREQVPPLKLTAENLKELEAITNRDGFTPFDSIDLTMMAEQVGVGRYGDFRMFIRRASSLGLNPLDNDIHMEYKYSKGQAKPMFFVHIDGWRKIADQNGELDGFKQVPGQDENGRYIDTIIWRKGRSHPFESRVYMGEFSGQLHGTMPMHMLGKVGEALGYKRAFPVSGVMSDGEVEAWREREPDTEPTPSKPEQQQAPTGVTNVGGYAVAEKKDPAPATEAPKQEQVTPAATTAAAPAQGQEAQPEDPKQTFKRLFSGIVALGVTKQELETFQGVYFAGQKPGPAEYIALYEKLTEVFKDPTVVESFRSDPAAAAQVLGDEDAPAEATEAEDPALIAARNGVAEKFPNWTPELIRLGSMWCADRMQSAAQLDAFLIANGMQTAPPGRVEAFLSITRHFTLPFAPKILAYAKRTQMPLSEIERQIEVSAGVSPRDPSADAKAVRETLAGMAKELQ